jgi:SpoVK/Ycf46/Vps4 family AAA+-type ATPase
LLFLTTNRVESFDEAFVSRIHLAVYYPSLNKGQNRAIWETNLDRAKKRKPTLIFDKDVILDWADANWEQANQTSSRWNGRQIRNGCQTAIALAESEAEKTSKPVILEVKHIERMAKASKEFYDYVSDTLGSDMAHRAMVERLRLDDWLPNLPTSRALYEVTRARHQVNQATEDFTSSTRNRNVQQLRRSGGRNSELLSSSGGGGRGSPHTPATHSHQVQSVSHDDYDDFEAPVRLPARRKPGSMRREMSETHVLGYDDEYDEFE